MLHVLSQRPGLTGSGVTLDALTRHGAEAGWSQQAAVGTPADGPLPQLDGLAPHQVHPLLFGRPPLDFPVPGMSDVMPYPSTRFSQMTRGQLELYRDGWRAHLREVAAATRPRLVHAHHLWLMAAQVARELSDRPIVLHCHATGLRQMELCPELADEVRAAAGQIDHFLTLHRAQADQLADALEVDPGRVTVVGAGYRQSVFAPPPEQHPRPPELLYAGKLSRAKGLPWLLEAVERLARRRPRLRLHVAGAGAGGEAEAIEAQMREMGELVVAHGQVDQRRLAELMRHCAAFVLPSFYEGLPLVLVEALACGCRPVCTALPVVTDELAPSLGEALAVVPMPRRMTIDRPHDEDLPGFVDDLVEAIEHALDAPPPRDPGPRLEPFTWRAVFDRVEAVWRQLLR